MPDLSVLDPQPLRDLLEIGATEGLVQELIVLYQEDIPGRIRLLQKAVEGGDTRRTMAEAHGLKGALGNLGLLRFAHLVEQIETEARRGHLDTALPLSGQLQGAYEDGLANLVATFPPT